MNLENLGISASSISLIMTLFIVYTCIISIIALILYFLKAIGIYNMSLTAGLKNPWMAFVPILNNYTFGKLAEKYNKRDGKNSLKFGTVLLVLSIIFLIIVLIFAVFSVNSIIDIIVQADKALQDDVEMTISMFTSIIPVIVISFVMSVFSIVYAVIKYIALWRIFSSFDYKNATLFTVLSVFFNFLQSIFLFVIRKNPSTFDYSERMGTYTNNY